MSLLTFSREFKSTGYDQIETGFRTKIISGDKKHTFRTDASDRWKPGSKISYWDESPRNTTLNPEAFLPSRLRVKYWLTPFGKVFTREELFYTYPTVDYWNIIKKGFIPLCSGVEYAKFTFRRGGPGYMSQLTIGIGGNELFSNVLYGAYNKEIGNCKSPKDYLFQTIDDNFKKLVFRDGFQNPKDFLRWFDNKSLKEGKDEFTQKIIHWNDEFYVPETAEQLILPSSKPDYKDLYGKIN